MLIFAATPQKATIWNLSAMLQTLPETSPGAVRAMASTRLHQSIGGHCFACSDFFATAPLAWVLLPSWNAKSWPDAETAARCCQITGKLDCCVYTCPVSTSGRCLVIDPVRAVTSWYFRREQNDCNLLFCLTTKRSLALSKMILKSWGVKLVVADLDPAHQFRAHLVQGNTDWKGACSEGHFEQWWLSSLSLVGRMSCFWMVTSE